MGNDYQYGYLLPQWRTYTTITGERVRELRFYELWRAGQLFCCVQLLEGPYPLPYDAYQTYMINQTVQEVL